MTFYPDADGDGAGAMTGAMEGCAAADGFVAAGGDCDDDCASCFVGGQEACDGKDNDCDETLDEGLSAVCGSVVGICREGTQACVDGVPGECVGGVVAGTEVCDGSLDEDCDGTSDEGCACGAGMSRACGSGEGSCEEGVQACQDDGVWGGCSGGTGPTTETCDNADNDCDAKTDELISETCGTDVGACTSGTSTCSAGVMGACVGSAVASDELCDGIDNDCDNVPDDNLTRPCDTADAGKGICKAGTQTCSGGSWGVCTGSVTARAEVCDAPMLDENCNGTPNEGCACSNGAVGNCGTDVGACDFGTWTCTDGRWGPTCTGGKGPAAAETCNNIDDNCDGNIDEGLTRACGRSGTAPCRLGTETCQRGAWVNCTGNIDPAPAEICDAPRVDENCNGTRNEGCTCVEGQSRVCGKNDGECTAGLEYCADGNWSGTCVGEVGPKPAESCNGLDDDCDNKTDESSPCGGSLQCVNKECVCTKNSDCAAGSACGMGECSVAYTFCDQQFGDCPPGFHCNSGSGSGLYCKPPCTAHADCTVPPGSGSGVMSLCYPFTSTQSYCFLSCTAPNTKGGCPGNMVCMQSLPHFCGYPPS
jgi:hypothetical protein